MPTGARFVSLRPSPLPWRRPRHELLLVVLVSAAVLSPVYIATAQDTSRLCLTRALEDARLTVSPCVGRNIDQAHYDGRVYSDKAPGMSVLALPGAAIVRLPSAQRWVFEGDARLWAVRLLSSGIAFVFLLVAVGRVSEGVATGAGGFTLVAFGLGTLAAPLAATTFGHVTAGALAFGAFLLCSRERPAAAGLAVGSAIAVEYQAAAVGVVLAAYLALSGARPLLRYSAAAALPLAGLAAYNWRAFGSPFHLSYRYIVNQYSEDQGSGLFGIGLPDPHAAYWVLLGDRGLLVTSPVLVAAVAGLALMWKRYRVEAYVCVIVGLIFLALNCGYFLPYGGTSPGPRFLVPALPFVAVGLGSAFSRWPRVTAALGAASIIATVAVMLTWTRALDTPYRHTVWGEIGRLPIDGEDAQLRSHLTKNALEWVGVGRYGAAAAVAALAAAAMAISLAGAASRTGGASAPAGVNRRC